MSLPTPAGSAGMAYMLMSRSQVAGRGMDGGRSAGSRPALPVDSSLPTPAGSAGMAYMLMSRLQVAGRGMGGGPSAGRLF
jgi:hypothetical protein